MTPDDAMRDALTRLADETRVDLERSLSRVRSVARQRQRRQRVLVATLAAAAVVVAVVGVSRVDWSDLGQQPPSSRPTPSHAFPRDQHRAGHTTLLDGEWRTAPIPVATVRAAADAAGVSRREMDAVLDGANRWQVDLTINQIGHGGVVFQTWDPDHPTTTLKTASAYAFTRLGRRDLRLEDTATGKTVDLVYTRDGDTVTLHPLASALRRLSPTRAAWLVAWTSSPFEAVR